MRIQRPTLRKTECNSSSTTSAQPSLFKKRAFTTEQADPDQVSSHQQELPDLQTLQDRSARFRQSLSRMKVGGDRPVIQLQLAVGAPGDRYEQEADQVAERVMSMAAPVSQQPIQREAMPEEEEIQTKPLVASITPLVQREAMPEEQEEVQTKPSGSAAVQLEAMPEEEEVQTKPLGNLIQREAMPEEEEIQTKQLGNETLQREAMPQEEEEIQTKRSPDAGFQAGSNLESRLNSSQGGGSPLSDEVRSFMEPRFGADFSQVRVHTGSEAVQMNQDLNAQAFTHKQDVYFGAGKAPANDALTAHELTHVVQQTDKAQTKPSNYVDFVSPTIQRAGGWSDAKGGPNSSESAVGGIRRIPIEGLALGNQTKASNPDTDESAIGKAVILIPQALGEKPEPGQVEVLFHLHGFSIGNGGYRKRTRQGNHEGLDKGAEAPGTVRDVAVDKIEQQLEASGRTQMIGILPQGGNRSQFGDSGLDIDKYISEVLVKIQPLTKWSKLPTTRVVMSAHSGGGGRIAEMISGTKGKLPASMGELILFDAINGLDELKAVTSRLLSQIDLDMSNLTGKPEPDQRTYLKSSLRFRGYFTEGGYRARYKLLKASLKKRLNQPDVKALPFTVAVNLRHNYQVNSVGHSNHEAIVGGAKNAKGNSLGLADPLTDALQPDKPPTSQSLSPTRSDEQGKGFATFARGAFTVFLPSGVNPKNVTDVKVHVFFAAAGVQGGIANDVLVHGLRGASDSSPWILIAAPGKPGGAFRVSDDDINDCVNSIGISVAPSSLRLTGHSRGADSLMASILEKEITTLSIIDHIFILDAADRNKIQRLVSMGVPSTKVTAYQVNVHASKKTKGATFIDLPSNSMAAIGYIRLIQDAMVTQPKIAALVSSNPDISTQSSLKLPPRGSFTTGTPTGSQVSLQGFCKINSSTLQQIINNDLNRKKGLLAFINDNDLAKFGTFKFSRGIAAHHFFVAEIAHELTQ